MATKNLSGTYAAGYTLTGGYSTVTISPTGAIGGAGLVGGTTAFYAIVNLGRVAASETGAAGIRLQAGGTITNGSASGSTALIAGASGGQPGTGGAGVSLTGGGTVGNTGTIVGGAGFDAKVYAIGGAGGGGIVISGAAGSVVNAGSIGGGGGGMGAGAGGAGIVLSAGGSVSNSGRIAGGFGGVGFERYGAAGTGILVSGVGSIANSGTITGYDSIRLSGGGVIGNSGLLAGRAVLAGVGSIANSGTVLGGSRVAGIYGVVGSTGILLSAGGSIGNSGLIAGGAGSRRFSAGDGVSLSNGGSVGNSGTISAGIVSYGTSVASFASGIVIAAGGVVTNGSAGGTAALITGTVGVNVRGALAATITNYGTIASFAGSYGTAVNFGSAGGALILEGGSKLVGRVLGGGGTLGLAAAGGPGTFSGLGGRYDGFTQIAVSAGASWTFSGANLLGGTLTDSGTLTNSSVLIDQGLLIVAAGGTLTGGVLMSPGGTLVLKSGAAAAGTVDFAAKSGERLEIDGVTMPTATLAGFVAGDTIDLADVAFDPAGSVTLGAGNVLRVTEGGATYALNLRPSDDFSRASFRLANDGKSGTLVDLVGAASAQLAFFGQGFSPDNINIVLTADGTDLPAPVAGKFNLEVFTAAAGAPSLSYGGSVFIQGAGLLGSNLVAAPVGAAAKLITGSFLMVDRSGHQAITVGRGGGSISVAGSNGDTITGLGSDSGPGNMLIDVSGTNPLVIPGAMTVSGGDGPTTVWGGSGDSIAGPADIGLGLTVDGARGGNTISGGANRGGLSGGVGGLGGFVVTGATVSGAAGDSITGAQGDGSASYIFAGNKDTITGGAGNTTVAGNLGSGDLIAAGAGAMTVYGSAGDRITGGSGRLQVNDALFAGKETVTGGSGNLFVFSIGKNFSITGSTAGTTLIDDSYGKGGSSAITGGGGTVTGAGGLAVNTVIIGAPGDTIAGGRATTFINGLAGAQSIAAGDGATTVQAGAGDTISGGGLSVGSTLQVLLDSDQASTTINLALGHQRASVRDVSVAGGKGGAISVSGFNTGFTGADVIQSKTSVDAAGKFLGSSASDGSGGTILTFLDGTTMILAGINDLLRARLLFSQ